MSENKNQRMKHNYKGKKTQVLRTPLRLHEETPAKQAYREALKFSEKPKGGHKLTWLKLVEKDLEKVKAKVDSKT
jgi:hypothetical protein